MCISSKYIDIDDVGGWKRVVGEFGLMVCIVLQIICDRAIRIHKKIRFNQIIYYCENKGIRDADSTADFRILFEIFEILETFDFF